MNRDFWREVIGRIVADAPLAIDADVFGDAPVEGSGPARGLARGLGQMPGRAPEIGDCGPRPGEAGPPPSARLLHTRAAGSASIGIRVAAVPGDIPGLAFHLAAMAFEKGVDPIILSACGPTGFEAFGFRVERLPEDPSEREQAEAELAALWGMAIIIDAADILRLG